MKKFFMVFMGFMVFSYSFFFSFHKVNAVGVDTAIKIVAGSQAKQLVRGIAEKAGAKLSGKALDKTVQYINNKAAKGDTKAIDFIKGVNGSVGTPSAKTGFKNHIITAINWITGLDLIFEAYDAFKDAFDDTDGDGNQTIDLGCYPGTFYYKILHTAGSPNMTDVNWYYDNGEKEVRAYQDATRGGTPSDIALKSVTFSSTTSKTTLSWTMWGTTTYSGSFIANDAKGNVINPLNGICNGPETVTNNYFIDNSNVSTNVTNVFHNDTYNTDSDHDISVDVPTDTNDDGDDNRVWNDIDVDIDVELNPPPPPPDKDGNGTPDTDEPDTDGDGERDDTDSTPTNPAPDDQGGLFENLIPILFLIKLLGLLGSVLAYFGRLLAFIMTIPIIPAVPIDNDAFKWFREAKILGIYIYQVVSSLAAVGLSFSVYRAVRRLF